MNKKRLFNFIKVLIAALSFGYIGYIIAQNPVFYANFFSIFLHTDQFKQLDSLWLALLLVPVNWLLEAYKWQYLASKIDKISVYKAFKAVLAGLCLGFITPHAMGDYVARIYLLKVDHKLKAVGAILIARISLFYITFFYGVIGFFVTYYLSQLSSGFFRFEIMIILIFMLGGSLILLLNYSKIARLGNRFHFFKKYVDPYFAIIGEYSLTQFLWVFTLSLIRFGVFTAQYLLVLQFFGVDVYDVLVVSAIWLIYLSKSIFPSFNFMTDLSVRESAGLFFLGNLGIESYVIVAASLLVWVINILIPAVVGLGFISCTPISTSSDVVN